MELGADRLSMPSLETPITFTSEEGPLLCVKPSKVFHGSIDLYELSVVMWS